MLEKLLVAGLVLSIIAGVLYLLDELGILYWIADRVEDMYRNWKGKEVK